MQLLRRSVLAATRGLLVLSVVVLALGCGKSFDGVLKSAIDGANNLQDAAGHAYNDAKVQEQAAGLDCAKRAQAAHVTLPPGTDPAALKACADLGVQIPYDPVKLAKLAAPLNAAYESIRGLNAARVAAKAGGGGDLGAAIGGMVDAVTRFYQAALDLGLHVDGKVASAFFDAVAAAKKGGA